MTRSLILLLLALLTQAVLASDMTSDEVSRVLAQAISRARQIEPKAVIAVVDREGFVLGVWSVAKPPKAIDEMATAQFNVAVLDAITKAGTAAFLSSDQNAFTSRTAGFIVQQHFPPGVQNRPNGPLVGVNFSNLSFSKVNRFKNPNSGYVADLTSGDNGDPIAGRPFEAVSGLAGSPGGVPLYRDGKLIGGVGVAGQTIAPKVNPFSILADIQVKSQRYDPDEDVALAGQTGFQPKAAIFGSDVFIDGIRVPYVAGGTRLGNVQVLGSIGKNVKPYVIVDSPKVEYSTDDFGGQECEIRAPIIADPDRGGPVSGEINGQPRLSAEDVTKILSQASARAKITRAGIRLPRGQPSQNFITVVNVPALPKKAPVILGTIRTRDATVFSWDVSAQKACTAVFFSNDTRAFSTRTVGFLSQQFYPPGIANTAPGPFYSLQERYSLLPHRAQSPFTLMKGNVVNPLNGVMLARKDDLAKADPYLPNGITIFPGGFPLYRNGVMIGAIGVSGDGIDQDDIIAAAGTVGFDAPAAIRADRQQYKGARLPYAKFPRNPDL
ncbi:MAG: heme-binding protein [Luteolibacter sp.]